MDLLPGGQHLVMAFVEQSPFQNDRTETGDSGFRAGLLKNRLCLAKGNGGLSKNSLGGERLKADKTADESQQ